MNLSQKFKTHIPKDTANSAFLCPTKAIQSSIYPIHQSFCRVYLEYNAENLPTFQAPVYLKNFVQSCYSSSPSCLKTTIRNMPYIVPKDCWQLQLSINASISYSQLIRTIKAIAYSTKQLRTLMICLNGSEVPEKYVIALKKLLLDRLRYIKNIKIVSEHNVIAKEAHFLLFEFLKANRTWKSINLSLSGNRLTTLQIRPLLQVISKKPGINTVILKLVNNKLSDEFLTLLMDCLLNLSSLQYLSLDISLNPITEKGLGTLARHFEELKLKLKQGVLNLKMLECDNIAYLRKLFGQYDNVENIKIMY